MKSIHHRQAAYLPIQATKIGNGKISKIEEENSKHKVNADFKKQASAKHFFKKRTAKS
jgi:hypothetical protein